MSAFGGLILTNKGRNLQAKAQLGTALHFTRIALGDYDIGGESILDLSSLKHEVKSLPIVKLKLLSGGKAVVGAVFSNEDMKSGFYWREIGIFANDPENGEILYCYGNAGTNAEYIPAGGGADIIEKSIDVTAIVGNTTNVTTTIDQSLIFASQKDIENKVDKVPGKQLSTEDYTTQEKQKLASLSNYSHPSEHPASMIKMGDGSTVEGKITSHLADYTKQVPYAVATGTANSYAVTLNPAPTVLTEGMALSVKINVASTSTSTLNVNGLGAKTIKKANGTAVTNLKANGIYTLRYDGINFILQGEGGEYGTAGQPQVLEGYTIGTDNGVVNGSMPNRGTFNLGLGVNVPAGYYSGGTTANKKEISVAFTIPNASYITKTASQLGLTKIISVFAVPTVFLYNGNYVAAETFGTIINGRSYIKHSTYVNLGISELTLTEESIVMLNAGNAEEFTIKAVGV